MEEGDRFAQMAISYGPGGQSGTTGLLSVLFRRRAGSAVTVSPGPCFSVSAE
jgi:hypothetical protein